MDFTVNRLLLRFVVDAAWWLNFADKRPSGRAENLWRTTCFELFLKPVGSESYCEYNFSSSTQWAAYQFDGYRHGMRDLPLDQAPRITTRGDGERFRHEVTIELARSVMPGVPVDMALAAVLEEDGGTKSYWALVHLGDQPDFHDPRCFVLKSPAPDAP